MKEKKSWMVFCWTLLHYCTSKQSLAFRPRCITAVSIQSGFVRAIGKCSSTIAAATAATAISKDEEQRPKILIVGAGVSGLAVAYRLRDVADCRIIEARNRIGGRVHSKVLSDDNCTIELGGQWIHEASDKNPIVRLLKDELKIPLLYANLDSEEQEQRRNRMGSEQTLFDSTGKQIPIGVYKAASKFFYKAFEKLSLKNDDKNTSLQDILDRALRDAASPNYHRLGGHDVDNPQFRCVLNYLIHRSECYEGGRFYELSPYLDDTYENLGGPDEIPVGGYSAVLQAVVDRIGHDKITLNMPVKAIDTSGEGVCITCHDGTNVLGDYCVCTVPLGVLQHRTIQFQPDLPLERWKALDSIGMGLLDKVVLKFDNAFWNIDGLEGGFGIAHEEVTRVQHFYDCSTDFGAPVLVMFLGGDAARRVDAATGLSDDEIVNEAMHSLEVLFGQDIPKPRNIFVTRWLMDPYSHGSYSFAKVGCSETAYHEVSEPIGKLLFAGEHTSLSAYACVHGAWWTGEREAKRLLNIIQHQAMVQRISG